MDRLKQKDRRHKNSLMVKGLKAQVNELSAKLTSLGQCGPITVSTPETSHGSGLDPVDGSITPEFHYTISQPDLFLVGSNCAQPSFFESSINPESSVVSIPAPNPMLSVGFEERLCARGQASHLEEDQRLQRHQQDCAGTNVAAANSVSTIQNTFNNLVHQACATERQYICADELLNQDALIRGIVHGWHTVSSLAAYCPLLVVIRKFDERIFSYSSTITRFCTLRMIHYMLLVCGMSESY